MRGLVGQVERRGGGLALALGRDEAAAAGAALDHVVAPGNLGTMGGSAGGDGGDGAGAGAGGDGGGAGEMITVTAIDSQKERLHLYGSRAAVSLSTVK